MGSSVRLVDVAKHAGVGVGTASRVINGNPSVKEKTRQRVLQSIDELGYQLNGIARSLKANKTRTIGVLIPNIANEFYADVVRGMEELACGQGYSYILSSTDGDPQKEQAALEMLCEKQVDGILMMSHTVAPEMLALVEQIRVPTVLVASGTAHPSVLTVDIDNQKAAYEAVQYLISLGHSRIAMVSGPVSDQNGGICRLRGYEAAMENARFPIPNGYIRHGKDYTYQTGYTEMERLLQLPMPPTAVFLAGDYMAIGAIRASISHGVQIPQQIAVMGFDNLAIAPFYNPPLSTVNQPRYAMGQEAVRLLLSHINKESTEQNHVLLPHTLERRESTQELAPNSEDRCTQ